MSARRLQLALVLVAVAVDVAACATPDASAVVSPARPPEDGFPYVAQFMEHRCGTLDCHGSVARNLRVYGDEGLRYDPTDAAISPCVPAATTSGEIGADYVSLVGVEPESLGAVVTSHGVNIDNLTMIAKPLGLEEHMGGTLFRQGDDSYVCMTSWILGKTDTASCLRALPPLMCGVPSSSSVDAGAD